MRLSEKIRNKMRQMIVAMYRRFAARRSLKWLNDLLFDCSLRGLGIMNFESDRVSGESYFVNRLLPKLVPTDTPVFFDIGANEGDYSLLLLEKFPHSQIIAMEPHPATFGRLKLKLEGKAKPLNCGAGSKKGMLQLYDRSIGTSKGAGTEHASLYGDVLSDIHQAEAVSVQVEIDTLDSICKNCGIERIDMLKIDTEGHELEVLRGAEELLARNAIAVIQIEFNEMNVVSRAFLRDFRSLLPGFTAYRLLPSGVIEIPKSPLLSELFGFQNIIFLPDSRVKG